MNGTRRLTGTGSWLILAGACLLYGCGDSVAGETGKEDATADAATAIPDQQGSEPPSTTPPPGAEEAAPAGKDLRDRYVIAIPESRKSESEGEEPEGTAETEVEPAGPPRNRRGETHRF